MNADRRKRLSMATSEISGVKDALVKISEIKAVLSVIKDEEETAMENVPESLQETDRYQEMEDACGVIEEAVDVCGAIEEAVDACDELVDKLQEINGVVS